MSTDYDVIVIGGGPVGEHCAGALADGGLRVALVERELVGGECSYYACIPSKTLLRPGEAVAGARAAPGAAEAVTGAIDVSAALAWRNYMVSDYDDSGQAEWLAGKDIALIRGTGRIAGPGVVEADGREVRAREIVIATGSDPVVPPIPGLRELDGIWTNREATGARSAPDSLAILGGGPVGVELAQVFEAFGTTVDLVEGEDHLLPREPRPLGEALAKATEGERLRLHLGQRATSVAMDDGNYVLAFEDGSQVVSERLLVATGRRPRAADVGLETVGIEAAPTGISVDSRMNVTEGVWAIGDVTGVWPLTYVGEYQARVAAANILGRSRTTDYTAVPRVVFTHPQAAAVGAGEGEHEGTISLASVPRTSTYLRAYDEQPWFLTLISDGKVLTGAYALGPDAGEWMQQATVAVRARIPLDVLSDTIQPFPTFSEAFRFALSELEATIAD